MTKYKRNEDVFLENAKKYIGETYSQHYVGVTEIQTIDVWESLGIASQVCQGTALKYLMRYGKKDGKNKKDLQKAIHYIVLLAYYDQLESEQQSNLLNQQTTKKY